jgi:cation transport ATPase
VVVNDDEARARAGFFRASSVAMWVWITIGVLVILCPCLFALMVMITGISAE